MWKCRDQCVCVSLIACMTSSEVANTLRKVASIMRWSQELLMRKETYHDEEEISAQKCNLGESNPCLNLGRVES